MAAMPSLVPSLDPETVRAVQEFVRRVSARYPVRAAVLYGSRARGTHRPDSDADMAILLSGIPGQRMDEALKMADIAFDVLMELGVLIEAIPFWEDEWEHPETFS